MWEPQEFTHFNNAYYGYDFNPSLLNHIPKFNQEWQQTTNPHYNQLYYGFHP